MAAKEASIVAPCHLGGEDRDEPGDADDGHAEALTSRGHYLVLNVDGL